jgi:hypothetical protein
MTSYSIAAGMGYLALFFTDIGEVERASFYVHCVRGYLKRSEVTPPPENESQDLMTMRLLRERFMSTIFHLTLFFIGNSMDIHRLFKCYLLSHLQFKQYKRILMLEKSNAPSMIGVITDENIDKFLPLTDMIRYDLENHKNTFNLTPEVIDMMTEKLDDTLKNVEIPKHEGDLYSKRLGFYMIAQGAKIVSFVLVD